MKYSDTKLISLAIDCGAATKYNLDWSVVISFTLLELKEFLRHIFQNAEFEGDVEE